jgi:YVTN family beta-propeller protein
LLAVPLAAAGITAAPASAGTTYPVTATIPVGPSSVWEGVAVDPSTQTVYVGNGGNGGGLGPGTVSVIDEATNTRTATISTPSPVAGVAVDPSTNTIYAVGSGSGGSGVMSVIDGATNTVTANVPTGLYPSGVAVDPDNDTVYVANNLSGTVWAFNEATNAFIANIYPAAGPFSPLEMAVDPSTNTIYVSGNKAVWVIDGATNTVTATIPLPWQANGIAVDPSTHTVYVAEGVYPNVSVINEATNTVTATVPVGNSPEGVAVDPSTQTVYVSNNADGTVSVIDGATDTVTATVAVGSGPFGVAVDPSTHAVYVANSSSNTVSVITPSATTNSATSLAVSPSGTANAGDTVTLTATEIPATAGTVQFYNGTSAVGSPVTVNAGTATYVTSSLATGSDSLTAVFTPSSSGYSGSTSPPVALQVTPPPFAIDQTITQNGNSAVTTPAFSTAGPRLLVAFTSSDGPLTKQTTTVTGAGLTWTLIKRANAKGGTAEIWAAQATGPLTGATVTSKPKVAGYDQSLTVLVFTGASGTGASASAGKAGGLPSVSLATTEPGPWAFGVGEDYSNDIARRVGAGQSLISQWVDPGPGETFWVQDQTAPTSGAGTTVTINDTAPKGDTWNLAAVEILPAAP